MGMKHLCFYTTSHEIENMRVGEILRPQRDSKSVHVHVCSCRSLVRAVMQVRNVFKHRYGVSNEAGLFSLPCWRFVFLRHVPFHPILPLNLNIKMSAIVLCCLAQRSRLLQCHLRHKSMFCRAAVSYYTVFWLSCCVCERV